MTTASPSVREQRVTVRGTATVIQAEGNVITGDVFVGPFARLRDRWLDPAPVFRAVQVDRFTGREWLVSQIDRFIARNDYGHIVVQADAGLGKTALAAWLARERGWPCHFTRLSNGQASPVALSNLGAQLIARYGLDKDFAPEGLLGDAAGEAGWFQRVLQAAADSARAQGERVVIVADGLDEAEPAKGALPLGLPVLLPFGVFLVLTCRTGTELPGLRKPRVIDIVARGRDNTDDLGQYLRHVLTTDDKLAAALSAAGQAPDAMADRLAARCGGMWIYLHYVLEELRAGDRSFDDIDSLPGDLFSFYAESLLAGHHQQDWGRIRLPLLATLAVAAEPVSVPLLTRLAGLADEHPVQVLCGGQLLPFLTVTPPQEDGLLRYSVYHASLREFLVGTAPAPMTGGGRAQAEEFARAAATAHSRIADLYLGAWGGLGQGLPELARDPATGQRDAGYALRHLTAHLERAGREQDLNALLALEQPPPGFGSAWYAAHEQAGTLADYRADLNRARRLAADRTDRALRLGRPAPSLALELRYLMIDAAIRANIPVKLIVRLVQSGLWSPARAIFYAAQPADPVSRAMRLAELLPALPEPEQPAVARDALSAAAEVGNPYWRARTYSLLADYIPQPFASEAAVLGLAATAETPPDEERAQLLEWLTEQLPAEHLPDATRLAQEIAEENQRVPALCDLVKVLPEDALPTMMAALSDVATDTQRENLIVAIASRKPAELAADLVTAARSLAAENRAWALNAIAEMTPAPDPALIAEALAAARETPDPAARANALTEAARHLAEAERQQVLDEALAEAASADGHGAFRVTVFIAESLPASRRRSVLRGLLQDTLNRPASPDRTRDLVELSDVLTEAQLARVIPLALATESGDDKAALLLAFGPRAPGHLFPQLWQAAAALPDEELRAEVTMNLALRRTDRPPAEALTVLSGVSNPDTRGAWIAELAGRLPDALLGQALSMAQSSASESGAAQFLGSLAQYQDGPRRAELLNEALGFARAATDGFLRAQALGDLAASLEEKERDHVLAEAGQATEEYPDDFGAVYALDYLIRRATGRRRKALIEAAFARTRAMPASWWRPAWLAALARYAPQPDRAALLDEALADARSIPADQERLSALINIAIDFPGNKRADVYRECAALAGNVTQPPNGIATAMAIIRRIPGRPVIKGLELLRRMRCEDTRLPPIGWLLRAISEQQTEEGLVLLRQNLQGLHPAHALGTITLYLPERVKLRMLRLALDAGQRVTARRALLTQARLLWPDRLTPAELEIFRAVMEDCTLDEFLSVLAGGLDLVTRAAGPQALDGCLEAFRTVRRWWPPFEVSTNDVAPGRSLARPQIESNFP